MSKTILKSQQMQSVLIGAAVTELVQESKNFEEMHRWGDFSRGGAINVTPINVTPVSGEQYSRLPQSR